VTQRQAAMAVVAGGILVGVGSLLPWATATTGFGTISFAGTEGDGRITIVLGALAGLLGFLQLERATETLRLGAISAGLGAGVAGLYDYANLESRLSSVTTDAVRASIGPGLYVVIIGAVVIVAGAWSLAPAASNATEPTPSAQPAATQSAYRRAQALSLPLRLLIAVGELVVFGSVLWVAGQIVR
jgi:hypothetical protein